MRGVGARMQFWDRPPHLALNARKNIWMVG